MGQGIIGNMWVCPGLSLLEPGVGIQLSEGKALTDKKDASRWSRGINIRDTGILNILLGSGDGIIEEDGIFWEGTDMELL